MGCALWLLVSGPLLQRSHIGRPPFEGSDLGVPNLHYTPNLARTYCSIDATHATHAFWQCIQFSYGVVLHFCELWKFHARNCLKFYIDILSDNLSYRMTARNSRMLTAQLLRSIKGGIRSKTTETQVITWDTGNYKNFVLNEKLQRESKDKYFVQNK